MIARTLVFELAVGALLLSVLVVVTLFLLRSRKTSKASWQDLLARLQPVNREHIARVISDRHADQATEELTHEEIWELTGGLAGLQVLRQNCAVLVDLAAYVQQWYPAAVALAEQLRLNAREIDWHVSRLEGAEQTGNLKTSFANYAQQATTIYDGMTRAVLALYEQGRLPQAAALRAAL